MRYYVIQQTAQGWSPLPYSERGFASRGAAYRFMRKHGDSWCKTSNKEAAQH